MKFDFTGLLKNEMKPALGVTEVGAIALAAARAYAAVGGKLQEIRMVMNGGMYKNAFSCAIPGTQELGCNMAAALGALGGDWTLGLEVLKNITAAHVAEAKTLQIPMDIKADETKEGIYILAEIRTSEGVGVCRIEDFHANIVFVAKNDTVLFQAEQTKAAEQQHAFDFEAVTVADMVDYAKTVPIAELSCVKEMIAMNCALSAEGEKGVGLQIWKTLAAFRNRGAVGDDMIYAAQRLTCSAMDARLAGLPFPAMSIVGSGSHGILCSMPVVCRKNRGRNHPRRGTQLLNHHFQQALYRQTFCPLRLCSGRWQRCGGRYCAAHGRQREGGLCGNGSHGGKSYRHDLRWRQYRSRHPQGSMRHIFPQCSPWKALPFRIISA